MKLDEIRDVASVDRLDLSRFGSLGFLRPPNIYMNWPGSPGPMLVRCGTRSVPYCVRPGLQRAAAIVAFRSDIPWARP